MDDCNLLCLGRFVVLVLVQIPLWTIVTISGPQAFVIQESSDSSMDDCNAASPPTFCPVLLGSDSSMDDCNSPDEGETNEILISSDSSMDDCNPDPFIFTVQAVDQFRFLYGRL